MKKALLIFFLVVWKISNSQPILKEEALQLGKSFFDFKGYKYDSKNVEIKEVKENDTIFFYEIYAGNASVIISSNYLAGPILAYSFENRISFSDLPDEHGANFWVDGYKKLIRHVLHNPTDSSNFQKKLLQKLLVKNNSKEQFWLIKTKWNQDVNYNGTCGRNDSNNICYNKFVMNLGELIGCDCGRCPVGCVAVAVGQIMRYWKFPYLRYDWCNMPAYLDSLSSIVQADAIARLLKDVANAVEMFFCIGFTCNSFAWPKNAEKALKDEFNYHNSIDIIRKTYYSQANWKKKIRNQLDDKQPVFYSGCESLSSCHAFICDGYDYDETSLFHFNFGWSGDDDGFYFMFDDDGNNFIEFKKYQEAIINIKPSEDFNCNNVIVVSENFQYGWPTNFLYYHPRAGYITTSSSAQVVISAGEVVDYKAFNEIIIDEPFVVEPGGEFSAEIVPCPKYCDVEVFSQYNQKNENNIEKKDKLDDFAEEKLQIQILSNPVNNNLVIKLNDMVGRDMELTILNVLGQVCLISNFPINDNTITIDVSSLKSGFYLLKVKTGNLQKTASFIKL
jgi:hypothetical protein